MNDSPISADIRARAGSLFDAYCMSGSINMGAGHTKYNIKFMLQRVASEEATLDALERTVAHYFKESSRKVVYEKLKQIALDARKEAGQSP